ncbi:DUF4262 domain-containing protein [Dactylosporangium vinaceum]|uniref:DUF4262 domain-containing protein n=1 Tax=Dactylosporangium vinaceum TaxID=53362 RepID=A0ABV5M2F9_9ACTN|nr:DUF4262 domain-containing protein [Dactylosporangium vinaceum]UAB96273.1 DUF4262 domain-containing protein [Dactylosporangium vinaceum]
MPGLEDFVRRQTEIIQRVGWAVMHILPTEDDADTVAPYSYTVGLTARIAPEFVITGLHPDTAQHLLNEIAGRVHHGAGTIAHNTRVADLIAGFDAVIIDGTPTDQIIPSAAIARYGADQVRLQQVVWPDPNGRLPWEPGYSLGLDSQPLIGTC